MCNLCATPVENVKNVAQFPRKADERLNLANCSNYGAGKAQAIRYRALGTGVPPPQLVPISGGFQPVFRIRIRLKSGTSNIRSEVIQQRFVLNDYLIKI